MVLLYSGETIAGSAGYKIINNSKYQKLHTDISWLNLLHYQNGKSLITDKKYFMAVDGNTAPKHELIKSVDALINNKDNFACRFPARVDFLIRKIPKLANKKPDVKCPELNEYLHNLSAEKYSLVFATEKFNSSLSMMGHIFIKIEGTKKQKNKNIKKVNHSLSFYADLTKMANPITFIPKSLLSGVNGLYVLEPYDDRKMDYVVNERRNLLQYDLELTKSQVRFLTLHIWELRGINIDYHLYNSNCASALSNLLRVVKPEYNKLSFKKFITPVDLINQAIYLGYINKKPSKSILLVREDDSQKPAIKKNNSSSLYIAGQSVNGGGLNLKYSVAYNDLMDNNRDFNTEFEIKIVDIDLSYLAKNKNIKLNNLTLYKSQMFVPSTISNPHMSELFEFSLQSKNEHLTTTSLMPYFALGRGYTVNTGYKYFIPYGFITLGYFYNNDKHNKNHNLLITPEIGFFAYLGESYKLKLSYNSHHNTNAYKYNKKISIVNSYYLYKNITLKADYDLFKKSNKFHSEFKLGLRYNF